MSKDARQATYLLACFQAFKEQTRAGRWPKTLTLPTPKTAEEEEALELFMQEIKQTTGASILVGKQPHDDE